jgi:hypothetical protein
MSKDQLAHRIKMLLQEPNQQRPVTVADLVELANALHIEIAKKKSKKGSVNEDMVGVKQLTKKQKMYAKSQLCALCLIPFTSINEATIDHIMPKSKGGSNDMSNLQLAHFDCNNKKGDKIL